MLTVFDVAGYILKNIGGAISTMKLQKLCYYSQAWNLVWNGKKLFKEDFYKWDNGPVCRELFDIHKGLFYISYEMFDELVKEKSNENKILSKEEQAVVNQIIEDYGKYNGSQLSEMTHQERPWIEAKKDDIISTDCMKKYYEKI